jgi:putative ABC transport system substrate-binding protein
MGLLGEPLTAEAQPAGGPWRIGFLGALSAAGYASQLSALRAGLRDLGYDEGRNLVIDYRWAQGKYDRLPDLAAELVRAKVELIVTHGTPGSRAAMQTTATVPIVMAVVGDPVETGLVSSLARPDKNATGLTFFNVELVAKRLELLRETLPGARRVAILLNPDNPVNDPILKEVDRVAGVLKVELQPVPVRDPDQFEGAFAAMTASRIQALVVIDDGMLIAHARRIADLAAARRLPGIGFKEFVVAGGLMAYAVDFPQIWRRAAVYVDRILKGAKPGSLPIERATHFEFVLNLRAAKALGLGSRRPCSSGRTR